MLTKKELKLLTEVLNLEGVKVSDKHQHKGIGIILKIESIAKESICKICGTKSDRLHLLGATHAPGFLRVIASAKPSTNNQRFGLGRASCIFRDKQKTIQM
jgi:hypothetical protein